MEATDDAERGLMSKIDSVLTDYHLNALQKMAALRFIKEKVADQSCDSVQHVRSWLLHKVNAKPIAPPHPRQLGCPDLVPGLRAQEWWDEAHFPWLSQVEACYNDILEELLALHYKGGFQPYRGPSWATGIAAPDIGNQSHDSGDWNVFYLYLHGMEFSDNLAKCPKTVAMINNIIPRHFEHAFFSAVNPHTHIMTHHGPNNKKLRLHLPMTGLEGTRLRVADEVRSFEAGKVRVFDDSFDHEAWHDGETTRINLIVDFWHPELSDDEVKFFKTLQNAKLRTEKRLTADMQDTFFSVIERAKELRPNDNSWWALSEADKQALSVIANSEVKEVMEEEEKTEE
jgi:aspartate beta-hydroxylase